MHTDSSAALVYLSRNAAILLSSCFLISVKEISSNTIISITLVHERVYSHQGFVHGRHIEYVTSSSVIGV